MGKLYPKPSKEESRAKRFATIGYKTLFLDDDDLCCKNWKEICLEKIKDFMLIQSDKEKWRCNHGLQESIARIGETKSLV